MAGTAVKICGLRSVGMIESMINLPIDYIGFVFAESKRKVTPESAAHMIAASKNQQHPPQTVGVFVNAGKDELRHAVRTAGLDAVQLHGDESADFCDWAREALNVKVFKVLPVSAGGADGSTAERLKPFARAVDGIFLDTYDPVLGGGTGKTFSWEMIPTYQSLTKEMDIPLIIAGGLHADNVGDLIRQYAPDGVDVSSGVETNGEKDIEKIRRFVERVRNHG